MTVSKPAAEPSNVQPLKAPAEKLAQSAKHMEKSAGTVAHTTVQLPGWLVGTTGTVLVLFSTFCFIAAVWRQLGFSIERPEPDNPRLPAAVLIAVNGFLVIVTIFAMVGIWGGLIRPALG